MKEEIVAEAIKVLKNSGTILYPTDTIWGIGCDALDEVAVRNIYTIKYRDITKSMLILVDSIEMLANYVEEVPAMALKLIDASTRPLTIIYPKPKKIAKNLIAADNTFGIRVTRDEFCKSLIKEFGRPIVSTSANLSGQNPPLGYFDVSNEIKMAVDYIVPLRLDELSKARSSDVVRVLKNGEIEIIR